MTNRFGITTLDDAVAAEVRAAIARTPGVSVKSIAEKNQLRRATLSARVNGHVPFAPALLGAVGSEVGLSASEIVALAEAALAKSSAHAIPAGAVAR